MSFFFENKFFLYAYLLFQIFSFIYWFHNFDKYILISLVLSFLFFKKLIDNKNNSIFILVLFILFILYSTLLSFERNPLKYYEKNNLMENEYVIESIGNKGYARGDLGDYPLRGLDTISMRGYVVDNSELNKYILLSCSTLNEGCPYSQNIGEKILVKHLENKKPFYYVFYVKKENQIFNEDYFISKYKNELKIKLNFILFDA